MRERGVHITSTHHFASKGMRLFSWRGQTTEEGKEPKKWQRREKRVSGKQKVEKCLNKVAWKMPEYKNYLLLQLFEQSFCCSLLAGVAEKRKTLFYLCDEKLESEVINLLRISLNAFQHTKRKKIVAER
jgi:hypothetical protein